MKKTDPDFVSGPLRRTLKALALILPLTLFAVPSIVAQISFPISAAPVSPLVAAAAPSSFAELAASHPLQLPIVISGDRELSSSIEEQNALPQDPGVRRVAPLYAKYIPSGWTAQPIDAHDKLLIGLRDLVNPVSFSAKFFAAGYEQLTNGAPNYGTDRGAFGERLGAAALRETTQGLFTDALFAPLLHEDPRYYIEGPDYSLIHRALYAATRPFITRTDSGYTSINGALLLGYAASSALSYTYYPKINQNFHDTASTFGGGIGGSALGYLVTEFSPDILQVLHLKRKP